MPCLKRTAIPMQAEVCMCGHKYSQVSMQKISPSLGMCGTCGHALPACNNRR